MITLYEFDCLINLLVDLRGAIYRATSTPGCRLSNETGTIRLKNGALRLARRCPLACEFGL